MADDVTITVHVRDLTGPGFHSVSRNLSQLQRQANQMGGSLRIVGGHLDDVAGSAANAGQQLGGMGLRGQLIGVGAAIGTTLLPTLGALAPMLTGLAAVGGGAALAMDDLKKKAKELKKPFEDWQKVANKAVAPHTEKAVKSLKSAMQDLTPVIEVGADTFGRITEKAARFADSPAFKSSLAKNAEMGAQWVEQFAGSVGTFTQAFLDFGTKSQPALDAWQDLLGGMLDTGLPDMFREMEQGIGGSSEFLSGLAELLNGSLLPSLGKIAGSFADAFGPMLGEMLITAGNAVEVFASLFEGAMAVLRPAGEVVGDTFRALNEVFRIGAEVAGSFARNVGGALVESLMAAVGVDTSGLGGDFRVFSDWVKEHQAEIRGAMYDIAGAITLMVSTGLQMLPLLYGAFEQVFRGVLLGIDLLVSGLATAFGHLPVVGDMFEAWNTAFDDFSRGARLGLDEVGDGIDSFVGEAIPRLGRAKLKMNIDEAQQNLNSIKSQLKDPELTRERKAQLTADKREAEATLAAAKRQLAEFDKKQAKARLAAEATPFWDAIRRASGARIPSKTARIVADTGGFWSAVRGLTGQVLGTSYINVQYRRSESQNAPRFRAMGGPIRLADGGMPDEGGRVVGPGTETSDSIPAMLSAGEYVIRASSVRKYGERFMDAVNRGDLDVAGFAKGGKVTAAQRRARAQAKAEAEARRDAWGDLTVSHFGQMAGWRRSEFNTSLARPDSLSSLVGALNQWASVIKKATHGSLEKGLLKALDSAGKKLIGWEKQLTSVGKELDRAKDRLSSLRSAASQLAGSVRSGVLSASDITRGAGGDGLVTVGGIMGGLTQSRDKATAFASALQQLRDKGLSSALLRQVAEAGISGGGLETAGALLGASSSEIASMNSLQSEIAKAASTAGKVTADAVYGKAIAAQERLVKQLGTQQKNLMASMDRLAGSMEKLLERSFKGKAAGGIVGMAASGGIRSNLTWVGEQGPELLDLPAGARVWSNPDSRRMQQQAWASMLNTPRRGPAPVPVAAAGGEQKIVLEIRAGDNGRYTKFLVDELRRAVRDHGGIETTLRPTRGR